MSHTGLRPVDVHYGAEEDEADVDPNVLVDISAGIASVQELGSYDRSMYETLRNKYKIEPLRAKYRFDLDGRFDVAELLDARTVGAFAGHDMNWRSVGFPGSSSGGSSDEDFGPALPVFRFALVTPIDPSMDLFALMEEPWASSAVVAVLMLGDEDRYHVIGALYRGIDPSEEDVEGLRRVLSDLEDRWNAEDSTSGIPDFVPAPFLDEETLAMIRQLATRPFAEYEKHDVINKAMSLDDLPFIEAASRIVPRVFGDNAWIAAEPPLAERAYEWARGQGKKVESRMMEAPWKTAWMMPAPWEPVLRFSTPRRNLRSVRLTST